MIIVLTNYNLYERLDKKSSLFLFLYRKRGGVGERVLFSRFVYYNKNIIIKIIKEIGSKIFCAML